jgi:hypothetical protein
MEEEQQQETVQPTMGEYQGKPIIHIPTVDSPNPDTTWHWMSFGKNKAKAIVKYFDAIKKFAEEQKNNSPPAGLLFIRPAFLTAVFVAVWLAEPEAR